MIYDTDTPQMYQWYWYWYCAKNVSWYLILDTFLADRTNGRAYATVLRPSVVVVVCNVMYCG